MSQSANEMHADLVSQLRRMSPEALRQKCSDAMLAIMRDAEIAGDEALAGDIAFASAAIGLKDMNALKERRKADAQDAVPVKSMDELEEAYRYFVGEAERRSFRFGNWLPSLANTVRPMVPGELVVLLADTGVGKTAWLQNFARKAAPQTVLMFELELPGTLCFERFVQMQAQRTGEDVFNAYRTGTRINFDGLEHVWVCDQSRLTPEKIEEIIVKSTDKIGGKPALVIVDYIGLVAGKPGKRYERLSDAAEQMKVIAKQTDTIIVMASQIGRPEDKELVVEPRLHHAKDSGSIENSAGLVLGAWRDPDDNRKLWLKVLKNTKGKSGKKVPCLFDVETMRIEEQVGYQVEPGDVPKTFTPPRRSAPPNRMTHKANVLTT